MCSTFVESCHTDEITFRLWQPLPAYVYDENGNRLWGNEQCGVMKNGDPCLVPGCTVSIKWGLFTGHVLALMQVPEKDNGGSRKRRQALEDRPCNKFRHAFHEICNNL